MSKTERIIASLAAGESLTAAEAARRFHCYCLHSRAAELRARGHRIDCRRVERNGRPIWIYSLRGK